MDDITALARQHGLKVIEDCAHAIETEHGGVKAGTFGEFACFSFYVTKNVVTGEGAWWWPNTRRTLNASRFWLSTG